MPAVLSMWTVERCKHSIRHVYFIEVLTSCSLFHRIVEKINNSIGQDPNSKSIIGVLDIYGFESFKHNR